MTFDKFTYSFPLYHLAISFKNAYLIQLRYHKFCIYTIFWVLSRIEIIQSDFVFEALLQKLKVHNKDLIHQHQAMLY